MPVTITGASDDLIELDGDVREEFNIGGSRKGGHLLAFSDGTVLRIQLTSEGDDGVWRIALVHEGRGDLVITQAPEDDPDNYSDRATLTLDGAGQVEWVALGTEVAAGERAGAT